MFYTAMDKRKRLNEKNDALREQACVRKGNPMSREEMQRSATRLHTNGAKIPRPHSARPASPPRPPWNSRMASAPRSPPATARPSSAPRSRPREGVY